MTNRNIRSNSVVDSRSLPWALHPETPGCAVFVHTGARTGPAACSQPPTATVLVLYQRSRATWRVYLCRAHASALAERELDQGVEPLAGGLQLEQGYRAEQYARALAGLTYQRAQPVDLGPSSKLKSGHGQ